MSRGLPAVRFSFARPVALELVLALVCSRASAAEQSATAPSSPTLEVEIAPTVPDAKMLTDWVREEGTVALTQLDPAPSRSGTILVSISGDLYDYQVSITTIRGGSARQESASWPCECTNDELLAQIRAEVEATAGTLGATTGVPDRPPTNPPRHHHAPSFQALELRGRIGLGLLSAGAAGTIAGTAFLGAGDRTPSGPDYRIPGVPTLVIGLGLLATGTTFIVLQHRDLRRRRAVLARPSVCASVTHRGAHMSFAARF